MIATLEDLKLELFLRLRNSEELVWKDKNGNIIPIKNLDTKHLTNIIKSITEYKNDSVKISVKSLNFY